MYGSPLHRQQCMSPKSTSITRASPQCHDFRCNQHTAVVWKFAHQLHILVATGIDSRVHLMRILAQHCAHGGADRPRSLNLKRVAPCHSSCTSPCTRFGNNQRVSNNNWQRMCHTDAGGSVHNTAPRRSNDSRVHSSPNRTTAVRTTRACRRTSLCNLRAHSFAAIAGTPNRNEHSACTRTASSWLHTMHRNSAARMSQLLGRFSEIEDLNRV